MTEKELAGLFTPPNPKLAAVRKLLIGVLEKEIREANQRIIAGGNLESLRNWRNGLGYARMTIGTVLDSEGKVLIDTLREAGVTPEEIELLTKN